MSNLNIAMGTYQVPMDKIENLMFFAIENSCTTFDTAPSYGTEKLVGSTINKIVVRNKGISRQDIRLIDKIDPWQMQKYQSNIEQVVDSQLLLMNQDYIDCYLIHWPISPYFEYIWDQMCSLKKKGKVIKIGVCNIDKRFIEKYFSSIQLPDVIQVERHPNNTERDVELYANDKQIELQAYSPLCRFMFSDDEKKILNLIGEKYNKTISQVILRWQLDTNFMPIVKTSSLERMKENLGVDDFLLEEEDIVNIGNMDKRYKIFPLSWGAPGY